MQVENESYTEEVMKIEEINKKASIEIASQYQDTLNSKLVADTETELVDLFTKTKNAFDDDKHLISKVSDQKTIPNNYSTS
jgi:hypothetical protein